MADNETTLQEAGQRIRSAHRQGKKTIVIDGVSLVIRKQTKNITLTLQDGSHLKKTENWLVAKPADEHRFAPVYSVEMEYGRNNRTSKLAKAPDEKKPVILAHQQKRTRS
jgi:hypothetical protein